jgi:hypothetical protein
VITVVAVLVAACGQSSGAVTPAMLKKDASGYPTCGKLGVDFGSLGSSEGPGVIPAVRAISRKPLSGPIIVALEHDGPAACASSQYPEADLRAIRVFLSTGLTNMQAKVLQREEVQYLRKTGLFDKIEEGPLPSGRTVPAIS